MLGELPSTCSLPLESGISPCSKTHEMNRPVCLEAHNLLAHLWQLILLAYLQHQYRLDCKYSSHNISNAKNFNPHKKTFPFLNMATFTQRIQRIWWPVASTTIVTGSYLEFKQCSNTRKCRPALTKSCTGKNKCYLPLAIKWDSPLAISTS